MTSTESRSATERSFHPRTVVLWKGLEYAGLALFTILVPRTMGPDGFGTFAAVLALVGLLIASTGLGASMTFGRFVPEHVEEGDEAAISRLYTQLLAVRVAISIPLAAALTVATLALLPELPLRVAALAAGSFFVGAVGTTGYQLHFGLNRLDRSLVRGALGRAMLVVGILLIGSGVTPGAAVLVLFVSESVLAAFALAWSMPYLDLRVLRSDLADARAALGFGAVFFGANLLLMGIWRGGEVAVAALADSRSEVAFYSIASAMTMALSSLLGQASGLLLPSVTGLHLRGEDERFVEWMAVPLRYVTVLAGLGAVVVFATADPVLPLLLGPDFGPVAANLKVLALGLIPLGLIRTATSLAAVQKTSRQAVLIGLEGFIVFFALIIVLVPRWGSIGASAAVAAAFLAAGLRAGYRMGLATIAHKAMFVRTLAATSVLGIFLVPSLPHALASVISIVTFIVLVYVLGVVRVDEIREGLRRIAGS